MSFNLIVLNLIHITCEQLQFVIWSLRMAKANKRNYKYLSSELHIICDDSKVRKTAVLRNFVALQKTICYIKNYEQT